LSLDAMDWVWTKSTAKGTARLVLLAIADKAYGKDCSAYAGTTMLVQRCNAARSSVIAAVDKLIETGELAVIEGRVGPRGETFYVLPKARRHRRSDQERGPDSGPAPDFDGPGSTPKSGYHSSSGDAGGPDSGPVQNPDRSENRTGTESGPGGSENRTPGGPKSGPHNAVGTQAPQQQEVDPSVTDAPHASTAPREITDEDKREFGRFWHNHPKSKDYDRTRDAWIEAVLAGADPVAISAAALAYAQEAVGTEFRFVKQSTNWLRERRYEDKYAAPTAKPKPSRPLPPWCGECADGARAAEREGHLRQIYDARGNAHPCPKCHPSKAIHAA
jgi:hypothetical protein